jgi:uncharacterized protein (DUF433 family)
MEVFMSGRYSLNLPVDLKRDAEQVAEQQGISLNQMILWSLTEKVTSLKGKLDDPNYPSIAYKLDSENQLVPVIRGKGIRVQTIVVAYHNWNEPVADIAKQYDLKQSVIKETLAFYTAHKAAVDSLIHENDAIEGERG